jgi:hypothetical protein
VLRLYVDGALAKEVRLSSKARYNDGPLYIARSSSTSSHNGMEGFLEAFRWYDRALTGAEVRELTVSTAPGPVASFDTDRSKRVSAAVFPDGPKLRTRELTVEFWIRNLSKKMRSSADNRDGATQSNRNDKEADSQDDDRVRSEEEVIADEVTPATISAVDPEVAELTKREADAEEDNDEAVQSINSKNERLPPPTAADALREAQRRVAAAYDKNAEERYRAYDQEHMGDFDDDVSDSQDNQGFEGLEDGDADGDDAEVEAQENADFVAEIERQRKLKVRAAQDGSQADGSGSGDGDGDGDDDATSGDSEALTGGYQGVTGLRAKKASVIANNEDKVTGFGDEDSGRKRRRDMIKDARVSDPARAVPRPDEEGTHVWDDDMHQTQKPDEDGAHRGDSIDDNQLMTKGSRTAQDGDIDPYLYGRRGGLNPSRDATANNGRLSANKAQEEARTVFEAAEAKAMLAGGNTPAQAAADLAASGRDGSVPTAEVLLSESSRRLLGASDDDSEVDYASIDDIGATRRAVGGSAASGLSSSASLVGVGADVSGEPANPLLGEMNPKDRQLPLVPPPKKVASADGDDASSGDKRRDFVTSEDGEEAIDEPATEGGEATSEHSSSRVPTDSVAAAKAALADAEGNNKNGDGKDSGSDAEDQQHLEPDDDNEAERYVTGTTGVPGRSESDGEARDDKDEDDSDLDEEDDSGADGQTSEERIAEQEEKEDDEEDEAGHVETESEAPRAATAATRMYDESYIGGRVGTPGRRPSAATTGAPKTAAPEDVAETKEDDSEADYDTGAAPKVVALIRKGGKYDEFTPTVQVVPGTLRIRGVVSTSKHDHAVIESRTSLFATKPNHVAFTINGRVLRLYINGVLDAEKRLKRRVRVNRGPLRVARGLRRLGVRAHMSGVRMHPRALRREELRRVQYSKSLPLRSYYNELVGDHLYSSRPVIKGVEGYRYLGIKGWVQSHPVPGAVPLYRFYNPAAGDHRYAIETLPEDSAAGYFYSGIVGYVYTQYRKNTAALIEYVNPLVGDHFYTTDAGEVADSFYAGYRRVGTVAYVEVNRVSPVPAYRLYDHVERPSAAATANYRGELNGLNRVRLLTSPLAKGAPFTLMGWFKIFDDATGEPRVMVRKGRKENDQTPSMFLGASDRRASIRVTTTAGVQTLKSASELPRNALVHVAITYDGKNLTLALNGQRDASVKLDAEVVHNNAAISVGSSDTPLKDGVGFRGRAMDLRWYQRAVSAAQLERIISVTNDRPALKMGYAPQFDEETAIAVPHQGAFNSREYTLFATVEPTGDCAANACRVLSKGGQPSIVINARGQLVVGVVTANGTSTVSSREALELKRPVSVAVVLDGEYVYLYLDGDLDGAAKLGGAAVFNAAPLTVGGKGGNAPGFTGYLTDVSWYRRAFAQAEIVALSDHRNPPTILGYERKEASTPATSVSFPHRRQFNTVGVTVTFWLKLLHHTDFTTALVTKGAKATEANPAVLLRKDGRIMVLVQTNEVIQAAVSTSKIPLNYPTHIAVSRAGRAIKIFINGKEDAFHVSAHPFKFNDAPITIGKIADVPSSLGWIRRFQWHDFGMERDHVDRTLRDTMY